MACRALESEDLVAVDVQRSAGAVTLARITGTPHVVERTRGHIDRAPTGSVAVYASLAGESFFHHGGGTVLVRPGQLLICDADRPFLRGFSAGLEELVVRVPSDLLPAGVGAEPTVVTFDDRAGGGRADRRANALARLVGRATSARATDADDSPIQESDLVAVLLGASSGGESVHLVAAQEFIREHLTDPALSASRVASAIGIGER